jgi:hypothetical protein
LVGEWEEKYASLKQLYHIKHSKFTNKASKTDQNIQTDTTVVNLDQMEKNANELSTKYMYVKKVCEWRKDEITKLQKILTEAGVPLPPQK